MFSIIIVVLEIPSGYFADIAGRKNCLVLASIASVLGFGLYSVAHTFQTFLIAEAILGLGVSLISGADSALLYDSLKQEGQEDQYSKVEGRFIFTANFSEALAAVLGGLLALISLRFPLYIHTALLVFCIPIACCLEEPARHHLDTSSGKIKTMFKVIHFALVKERKIKWLCIYSIGISLSSMSIVWFFQPLMRSAGLPLVWFGVFWAILNLSTGIIATQAYKVEKILGGRILVLLLAPLACFAYLMLASCNLDYVIAFVLVLYVVRGLNQPVFKTYINKLTPSEMRATVLSIKSMGFRLSYALIAPITGWIADQSSMQNAFLWIGLFLGLFYLMTIYFLFRSQALEG